MGTKAYCPASHCTALHCTAFLCHTDWSIIAPLNAKYRQQHMYVTLRNWTDSSIGSKVHIYFILLYLYYSFFDLIRIFFHFYLKFISYILRSLYIASIMNPPN